MMKKNILITIVITIAISIVIMLYGFAFITTTLALSKAIGMVFLLLIVGIVAGFIFAVIKNMTERIKEIKEEEDDGFSKY